MGSVFRMHRFRASICNFSAVLPHARTLALISLLYALSIGLTFFNKRYITLFPVPLSITMLHLIIKFLLSGVWRLCQSRCAAPGKYEIANIDWRAYFKRIVPTGIASALDIGFSNWSFEFISVSLYTMTKSTSIVFVLFFAVLLGLERKRWSAVVIVALIAGGLFMFTYRSTAFNLGGFLLVLAAAFVSGLRWTFSQLLLSTDGKRDGAAGHSAAGGIVSPVDLCYHVQPVMMLTLLPLSASFEGVALVTNDDLVLTDSYATLCSNLAILTCGALLAFALELTEYLVISWTSSITLSVAGIFKEVVTLGIATLVHGDLNSLDPLNATGLVLCLLGISLHVFVKVRSQQAAAQTLASQPATISPGRKRRTRSSPESLRPDTLRYSKLQAIESELDSSEQDSDQELEQQRVRPPKLSAVKIDRKTPTRPKLPSTSSIGSPSDSLYAPNRLAASRSVPEWTS